MCYVLFYLFLQSYVFIKKNVQARSQASPSRPNRLPTLTMRGQCPRGGLMKWANEAPKKKEEGGTRAGYDLGEGEKGGGDLLDVRADLLDVRDRPRAFYVK